MDIYETLNEPQREAVFYTDGPLLILAGAGSGKTRVLTHRIAYLIREKSVNPWNILAITFTNKAAGEMRQRVDNLVGFGSESIWVSTFHSACVRILRRYIDRLGYDTRFTIYDTDTTAATRTTDRPRRGMYSRLWDSIPCARDRTSMRSAPRCSGKRRSIWRTARPWRSTPRRTALKTVMWDG